MASREAKDKAPKRSRKERRAAEMRAEARARVLGREKLTAAELVERERAARRRYWRSLVGPIVLLIVGLAMLAAPFVMDVYESWKAMQTVSSMMEVTDTTDDPERLYYVDQANAYNAKMNGKLGMLEGDGEVLGYDEQMHYHDWPAMGWLQISKINIKVPIYHHANEEELIDGVGHLDQTSLPVGGETTHSSLSGHSGMTDKRMFDDVRKLGFGDVFVVWTLDEPKAYRVYSIEVVLPDQVDSLEIQEGKDICTLITCTPYGVNSHRLLVHGERCEYVPEEADAVPVTAYVNNRTVPLALGLIAVIATLVGLRVSMWMSKRRREREEEEMARLIAEEKRKDALGHVPEI